MCTVLLPPGVNSIAVNICIISYHIISLSTATVFFSQPEILPQIFGFPGAMFFMNLTLAVDDGSMLKG